MKHLYGLLIGFCLIAACDDKPVAPVVPKPPALMAETGTTITGNNITNPSGNIKFNVVLPEKEGLGWDLKYTPVLMETGDAIRLKLGFGASNKQNMQQEMVLQDSVLNTQGKVELSLKSLGFAKNNTITQLRLNYFGEFGSKTVRTISLNDQKTVLDTYTIGSNKQLAANQNDSRGVYCYRSYTGKWICTTRWDASNKVFMEAAQQETVLLTIEPLDSNNQPISFEVAPSVLNVDTSNISVLNVLPSPIFSLGKLSNATSNSNIQLPLHAKNATLGAMSIQILYDPAVLAFNGLANQSTTGIQAAANNGVIRISWFNASGFTWSDTKITDLQFTYKGGTSALQFLPETEVTKPDGRIVTDLNLVNGSVD